ncbi:MAG: antibiotic biosynthesis monooxygenase [Sphingomicrobium sp.]
MSAFSVVRFRIKPGRQEEFVAAHRKAAADWPGLKHANLVQVGERGFCLIAEWKDEKSLVAARPKMIKALDTFRDCLEVLSPKLGVTAPLSGPVVLKMK